MLIRQCINTFIRSWDSMAYVENQVNHVNRTFRNKEKDFVNSLSRSPQKLSNILDKLASQYIYFEENELKDFITELERLWFVVRGESEVEMKSKEKFFSYAELRETEKTFEKEHQFTDTGKRAVPWLRSLQLELTSLCNEKCIHCYLPSDKKDHGTMMPVDQAKAIIESFASESGLRIILSGGEVFMHKHIFEILSFCKEKDLMIFIQSNLTLLDEKSLKFIKDLNIFNMQVSLYSMDEAVHDSITKMKGSWIKTKRNLEIVVANDIPAMISCPIIKQNYKGYKDLLNYSLNLNLFCYIDYVLLAQSNLSSENIDSTRMTLAQTEELLDDIIEADPTFNKLINSITSEAHLDTVEFAQRFNKCEILQSTIGVTVNGDVYPCPGWQDMVVGSIHEATLQDIWHNSPKVIELRGTSKNNFKKCKKCDLKNYCDMCMVYNYNENDGDVTKVCTRFCDIASLLKSKLKKKYLSMLNNG